MNASAQPGKLFVYRVEDYKGQAVSVLRQILVHIADGHVVEIAEDLYGESAKMKRADL